MFNHRRWKFMDSRQQATALLWGMPLFSLQQHGNYRFFALAIDSETRAILRFPVKRTSPSFCGTGLWLKYSNASSDDKEDFCRNPKFMSRSVWPVEPSRWHKLQLSCGITSGQDRVFYCICLIFRTHVPRSFDLKWLWIAALMVLAVVNESFQLQNFSSFAEKMEWKWWGIVLLGASCTADRSWSTVWCSILVLPVLPCMGRKKKKLLSRKSDEGFMTNWVIAPRKDRFGIHYPPPEGLHSIGIHRMHKPASASGRNGVIGFVREISIFWRRGTSFISARPYLKAFIFMSHIDKDRWRVSLPSS